MTGSPPRVRGTGAGGHDGCGNLGITPACAGNRLGKPTAILIRPDHPRVCGEQSLTCFPPKGGKGSPPRVRGTVAYGGEFTGLAGITPACAGNSSAVPVEPIPERDHPRVCGEQKREPGEWEVVKGSPPRVRGTE